MAGLVLSAVRARAARSVAVLALTLLVTAAAAAGPWWMLAASRQAAATAVGAAPAATRTLSVRRISDTGNGPQAALARFKDSVERLLTVRDSGPVLGMTESLSVSAGGAIRDLPIVYRDDDCAHLRITGTCPSAPNQTVLSRATAALLGVGIGDTLLVTYQPTVDPIALIVVGSYELVEPGGSYWADPLFGTRVATSGGDRLDPAFVPITAFSGPGLNDPSLAYTTHVPAALLHGDNAERLADQLRQAEYTLRAAGFNFVAPTQDLLATIAADRNTIRQGVLLGAAEVVALCWFALGLAGRYTARDQRGDVALLKLRGSSWGQVLRLTIGQHLVPICVALPFGLGAGFLGARWLAGPVTSPADLREGARLTAITVLVALSGGLIALLLAEVAALRAPVAALLRRVPSRRLGWRGGIVDVVLVAVAVAAVYQARSGGGVPGFGLGAPALVALALVLVLARVLSYAADRIGAGALRSGRLRLGLAALQVSRQPGADRMFALVAVAVAVLGTAAGGFAAGSAGRAERAEVDLGAARVLTVQAANRTALLYAVRQADPAGRSAMAVVANPDAEPPVLAVDASRLAAVARWRPEYGPLPTLTEGAPTTGAVVTGTGLDLLARNNSPGPVSLLVALEDQATGLNRTVLLGPIPPGEHEVSAPVAGCTGVPGCRLVRLDLDSAALGSGSPTAANPGSTLTVEAIRQRGPDATLLDGPALGDPRRWRPAGIGPALSLAARQGTLTLTIPPVPNTGARVPNNQAFAVDTALPVPVVVAGGLPAQPVSDPAVNPFGGGTVPVTVVASADVLPVLGRSGVLVDLATVQRVGGGGGGSGTFEVWLADDAPAGILDRLRAAGLAVVAVDTQAAHERLLGTQGPAVAARFHLVAAGIGLLLAAAALAVSVAVERDSRAVELRSLRLQGLPARVASAVGYVGAAALVVLGVAGGLLVAVVAGPVAGAPPLIFADGWRALPAPGALRPLALGTAGLAALAVLGAVWWLCTAPLVRQVREGSP